MEFPLNNDETVRLTKTDESRTCVWCKTTISSEEHAIEFLDPAAESNTTAFCGLSCAQSLANGLVAVDVDAFWDEIAVPYTIEGSVSYRVTAEELSMPTACVNCGASMETWVDAFNFARRTDDGAVLLHEECREQFADTILSVWDVAPATLLADVLGD